MSRFETAHDYFEKCAKEWDEANAETIRCYGLWQAALARRKRLAVEKNNAWRELQMAIAERQPPPAS